MVTSISVALRNTIRRVRLLEKATAVLWQPGSARKMQCAARAYQGCGVDDVGLPESSE